MNFSNDVKENFISLLKLIIQSENDIKNRNMISQEEVFSNLEKKLFGCIK